MTGEELERYQNVQEAGIKLQELLRCLCGQTLEVVCFNYTDYCYQYTLRCPSMRDVIGQRHVEDMQVEVKEVKG